MRIERVVAAVALAACVCGVAAQDLPKAKVLRGVPMDKGQWRVDMIEAPNERAKGMSGIHVCQEAARTFASERTADGKAPPCTTRLVRDTDEVAQLEVTCPNRKPTMMTIQRESAKTFVMDMTREDGRPMKMRYTYEGACTNASQAMTFDKSHPMCQQMRAQAAALDPAKQCAGAGAQRASCEATLRQQQQSMQAMCQ
jgi:hypothetical protein